jgi:hypothetical protein
VLQSVSVQYAMDCGACNLHSVKPLQIVGDPSGTKVIALPQIEDFRDHFARGSAGRVMRGTWLVAQSSLSMSFVSSLPLVEGLT